MLGWLQRGSSKGAVGRKACAAAAAAPGKRARILGMIGESEEQAWTLESPQKRPAARGPMLAAGCPPQGCDAKVLRHNLA
jgi:hypothetical protein